MDELKKRLSINIRYLRDGHQMSLDDLCRAANVSRAYLGQLEQGAVNPSIQLLNRLAEALQVSVRDLLNTQQLWPIDRLIDQINALPPKETALVSEMIHAITAALADKETE